MPVPAAWINGEGTTMAIPLTTPNPAGAAALFLAILALCLCGCGGAPQPPSIIVITVDTLRADHLSCYGYFRETSPTIDALAEESVLFENVMAPMASTLPSHLTLFTSLLPVHHGIEGNFHSFHVPFRAEEGIQTAAQLLKGKGYGTAAFVSATPLHGRTGISAGFDVFEGTARPERRASETADRALKWLATKPEPPIFLWVHFFDPHALYAPPPPYDTMFQTDKDLLAFLAARGVDYKNPKALNANNGYDGEVRYVDDQIARLFSKLKELGLYDPSAIVFTSDHGEGLGQHNWLEHGRIHNEQLFVPLIIKLPAGGALSGVRRPDLVSLLDVLPSLAGALDLPLTDGEMGQFEGRDVLCGPPREASVFSQRSVSDTRHGPGENYALTNLKWKYMHYTKGRDALFNMETDRIERFNVIADFSETATKMKAQIDAILDDARSRAPALRKKDGIDPEHRKQLKSLGY